MSAAPRSSTRASPAGRAANGTERTRRKASARPQRRAAAHAALPPPARPTPIDLPNVCRRAATAATGASRASAVEHAGHRRGPIRRADASRSAQPPPACSQPQPQRRPPSKSSAQLCSAVPRRSVDLRAPRSHTCHVPSSTDPYHSPQSPPGLLHLLSY
eukprot:4043310-Prymnesium_polylepis.1